MREKENFLDRLKTKINIGKEEHPGVFFDDENAKEYMQHQMEYTLFAKAYMPAGKLTPGAGWRVGVAALLLDPERVTTATNVNVWVQVVAGEINKFMENITAYGKSLEGFGDGFQEKKYNEDDEYSGYDKILSVMHRVHDRFEKILDNEFSLEVYNLSNDVERIITLLTHKMKEIKESIDKENKNGRKVSDEYKVPFRYYDLIYENIEKYRPILDARRKAKEEGEYNEHEHGVLLESENGTGGEPAKIHDDTGFNLKQLRFKFGEFIYKKFFGTDAIKDNPYNRMYTFNLAMLFDPEKALSKEANFKIWQNILQKQIIEVVNNLSGEDIKKFQNVQEKIKAFYEKSKG